MAKYTLQATVNIIAETVEGDLKTNEMIEFDVILLKDGVPTGASWQGGFTPDYNNASIQKEVIYAVKTMVSEDIAADNVANLQTKVQNIENALNAWEYTV